MSNEDQINKLNSEIKCKIGVSKIHGVGVVVIRDILKGEKLYCHPNFTPPWFSVPYSQFSKLFPEVRELILDRWPAVINGSHFLSPNDMSLLATYINHHREPNYDVDADTALMDIPKGGEVLQDYRKMKNAEKLYSFL